MVLDTKFHTILTETSIEKAILELLKISETEINEWYFLVKPHIIIGTHVSRLNPKRKEQFELIKDNTLYSCNCYHQINGIIEVKLKKKRASRKKKVITNFK